MLVNIEAFGRGWRQRLGAFVESARTELLVCSPYIKAAEAQWVSERLDERVRLRVLTDVAVGSVQDRALDLRALATFARVPGSDVIALPRLHAKVFIADATSAIVTSANLTSPGLDTNYEYGVEVRDASLVQSIRKSLETYALLGSSIRNDAYDGLIALGDDLIVAHERTKQSEDSRLRMAFNERFRAARARFVGIQVGNRSANQVFGEAIRQALSPRPLTTPAIEVEVQGLLPELCDDNEDLIINGEHFGKAWKHTVRNAQQGLKRRGEIKFDDQTHRWTLVR